MVEPTQSPANLLPGRCEHFRRIYREPEIGKQREQQQARLQSACQAVGRPLSRPHFIFSL